MKLKRRFVAFMMCLLLVFSGLQITPVTVKAANPVYSGTHFGLGFDEHDANAMEIANGYSNGDMFNCDWSSNNIWFDEGKMHMKIDGGGKQTPYTGGEYRSKEYFGYGMYQVNMKPIKNPGVVTSFFTYTGPSDGTIWDEIDIEFLGYDTTKVQFNYYTNGQGGHEFLYNLGFDASEEYHTYGFYWGQGVITWYVDGKAVHTIEAADVPVTPSKIMMNVWPGTTVDDWLQPYNGKTPLVGSYDWISYDVPTGNADDENTDKDTAETPDTENTEDDKKENSVTHFGMDLDKHEDTMEMADGWTNGGMFDCTWTKNNISFADGKMNLKIDTDGNGGYTGGEYRTRDYYGYGMYQVNMKPIKNPGVVSSFFTYTGPTDGTIWDEIDIEFLGYDTTKVQFNYFSNGVGEHEYLHDLGFDASEEYHTYGFYWEKGKITWYVDNKPVHTVEAADVPVTPGKIMMNVWPGTTVDDWLKPYDGKTPLTASYDWAAYDAPQGEGETGKDDTSGSGDNTDKDNTTGNGDTTDKDDTTGSGDDTDKDDTTGSGDITDKDDTTGSGDTTDKDDTTGSGDDTDKDDTTGNGDDTDKDDTTGNGDDTDKDDTTGNGDDTDKDDTTGNGDITDKDDTSGSGDNTDKDDTTGDGDTTDKDDTTGNGDNADKDDITGDGDNTDKDDTTGNKDITDKDDSIEAGDNDDKDHTSKPEDSSNEKEDCKHDTTEIRNIITATCGKVGYTGDTYCTVCDKKIADGRMVAIPHTWNAGTITQQPSATAIGTKDYTCTVCNSVKMEIIPATGETSSTSQVIPEVVALAVGTVLEDDETGAQYRVLSNDADVATVEYMEVLDTTKKTVVIPDTVTINNINYKVTSIAAKAFTGCKNLRKVTIGKNINKIGAKAFFGCKNLKNITIKTSKLTAKNIGTKAFAGTRKGARIKAPKKVLKSYKKILAKKGMIF